MRDSLVLADMGLGKTRAFARIHVSFHFADLNPNILVSRLL